MGLTLISAPKPFEDARIAVIQGNALASWAKLKGVEVFLMGEGSGVADAARTHGAVHLPNVRTNQRGTPLISSMLELARRHGRGDLLGIVNADMILMGDLLDATSLVSAALPEYLLLARRWDLDVQDYLDFGSDWEARLCERVHANGELHRPSGSDLFVFPKQLYGEVPDFAVGRAGWDNWMIYGARRGGFPVIDCTASAMIVHQKHDYSHLPGGVPHYALPETDENIRLAGGAAAIRYTVLDATYELRKGRLVRPSFSWARSVRGLEVLLRRALFFLPPEKVEAVARPRRWRKRWARLVGSFPRKPGGSNG
jgi:hypothetical protein